MRDGQGGAGPPDNPVQAWRADRHLGALLLADPELLDAPMGPKELLQLLLNPNKVGYKQLGGPIIRHLLVLK